MHLCNTHASADECIGIVDPIKHQAFKGAEAGSKVELLSEVTF